MSNCKFEAEKFHGIKNLFVEVKIRDLLIYEGLLKALAEKEHEPSSMKDETWKEMD